MKTQNSVYYRPFPGKSLNVHPVTILNADSSPTSSTSSLAVTSTSKAVTPTTSSFPRAISLGRPTQALPGITSFTKETPNMPSDSSARSTRSARATSAARAYISTCGSSTSDPHHVLNSRFGSNSTLTDSSISPLGSRGSASPSSYTDSSPSSSPDSPATLQHAVTVPSISDLDKSIGANASTSSDDAEKQVGSSLYPKVAKLPATSITSSRKSKSQRPQKLKNSNGPLRCRWKGCNLLFQDAQHLYDHLCRFHVGRKCNRNLSLACQWENCQVVTVKRDHITSHLRVHIPLKPYPCEQCGKRFKRPQDLKKHSKIHSNNKKGLKPEDPQGLQTVPFLQKSHSTSVGSAPLPVYNYAHGISSHPLTSIPSLTESTDAKKRKFEISGFASQLPALYDDLKRSKVRPVYSNTMANKLNTVPLGKYSFNNNKLPSISANLGGFGNTQELMEASSYFNQISTSMSSQQPTFLPLGGPISVHLAHPSNAQTSHSTGNIYPSLPCISNGYYPQYGFNNSAPLNINRGSDIGTNQRTSHDDMVKRLAKMSLNEEDEDEEEDEEEEIYDIQDDNSSQTDSDAEDQENDSESKIDTYMRHKELIDLIGEYLEELVENSKKEDIRNEEECPQRTLYPTIKV
ncbi:hypothetical protein FOA43_002273 [Brettanomyces nanus]|uniref:C2H2-type domain-containing protein n=1 Tax=Eeniella nana TaxID=13502 RepID=A0A875S3I7_EENNA|nr:uncharacterized protein FOA43_002273 [Brettanomyces nanus]QPG74935.1 hypothetical protein FOA43_002273 [Brettanomyces nanus]